MSGSDAQVKVWFKGEIFFPRTLRSIGTSLVVQPVLTMSLLLLLNVNFHNPFDHVDRVGGSLLSLRSAANFAVLSVVMTVFGGVHSRNHTVVRKVVATRLGLVWHFLKPGRLVPIAAHCLGGAVMVACHLSLLDRNASLTAPCPDGDGIDSNGRRFCLDEVHLFVVFHGFYTGTCFAVTYYVSGSNYLPFPVIQQFKFVQIKAAVVDVTVDSSLTVLRRIKWFYLAYLLLGDVPRTVILAATDSGLSKTEPLLDSLLGLFNLHLFLTAWLTGTMVHLMWCISMRLFQIYQTEHYKFPIEGGGGNQTEIERTVELHRVMDMRSEPLISYLGFLDLVILSESCPDRRREIFRLSQPGGHPNNWNRLLAVCLSLLEELTDRLGTLYQSARGSTHNTGTGKPAGCPDILHKSVHNLALNNSGLSKVVKRSTGGVGLPPDNCLKSATTNNHRRPMTSADNLGPPPVVVIGYWFQRKLEALKIAFRKWPMVAYFVAEFPDVSGRNVFSECQPHIWAVNALSFLAAASRAEDQCGVVQGSLGNITTVLIDLQQALDKQQKMQVGGRLGKTLIPQRDFQLRRTLVMAVKSALHRIASTFQANIDDIDLPLEYNQTLKQYVIYK